MQFILFAFATFVAYTRVSDYKHHWSDVLVGAAFGSTIGIITVGMGSGWSALWASN